ncbi:cytosine/adenosine deaminase-related metal-dependent hydrolase [Mucilaginibacter gracilis]|uniref:Cytosine/adenosine deaminase-related metal-dependent hydrolase n=1 Tax=Mucilaginibacter gracilis TaxID=423350 RepID=A0A495J4C4_9SPHI|nr:amidohydrolase family protein [Mucilaginibacter gracilis]RKR83541.1 cytosine/adenosine deaminase-related metal-dependent hydrolase [Mucilaginibacter gracilis]
MVLNGVKLAGFEGAFNIRITGGLIASVTKETIETEADTIRLNLKNTRAFPGLTNSHDHLEFNLFPQLGDKIYANYVEWGKYIHRHYKKEIDEVLNIPIGLRARWGVYKNLLCGVTTVVNHGPDFNIPDAPITVFNHCETLHSVKLQQNWRLRLNNPLKISTPAVMHIGEGTDAQAVWEINELIRWNIFNRDLVGVHGVAMQPQQARSFKALIWCPETNYFLLNKTAQIDKLKNNTTILFGSDSALTAGWDIWKHIRLARKTDLLTDSELYQSLTSAAAKIWKLNTGIIEPGKDADVIIVKEKINGSTNFFDTTPEDILLVIHQGNIRLFDEELLHQLNDSFDLTGFSKIYTNSTCKYLKGDLPALINQIHQYYPNAVFPVQINQHQTT